MSAERLAAEDRCEEAIDARAARARARARRRRRRRGRRPLPAAPAALRRRRDRARRRAAGWRRTTPRLAVELVMAQYHLGDRARAEARSPTRSGSRPTTRVCRSTRGCCSRSAPTTSAAPRRRSSARASSIPSRDPYASYYAGLAWQRANERERARESLERARERAAGGPWAAEAERALAELDAGVERPGRLVARGGRHRVRRQRRAARRRRRSRRGLRRDDWRGVWSRSRRRVLPQPRLGRRRDASATRATHTSTCTQLRPPVPDGSVYLDRRVDDKSFLRLQPFGGYAWTDDGSLPRARRRRALATTAASTRPALGPAVGPRGLPGLPLLRSRGRREPPDAPERATATAGSISAATTTRCRSRRRPRSCARASSRARTAPRGGTTTAARSAVTSACTSRCRWSFELDLARQLRLRALRPPARSIALLPGESTRPHRQRVDGERRARSARSPSG